VLVDVEMLTRLMPLESAWELPSDAWVMSKNADGDEVPIPTHELFATERSVPFTVTGAPEAARPLLNVAAPVTMRPCWGWSTPDVLTITAVWGIAPLIVEAMTRLPMGFALASVVGTTYMRNSTGFDWLFAVIAACQVTAGEYWTGSP
jgi:hypothetical protein